MKKLLIIIVLLAMSAMSAMSADYKQVIVETYWIGSGIMSDPYRPAIMDEFKLIRCKDIDNKTPKPGEKFRVYIEVEETVAEKIAVKPDIKITDAKLVEVQKIPVIDGINKIKPVLIADPIDIPSTK